MKAAALPLMQVDIGEKSRLTRHLNLKDRGAYERLLDHYWEWGRLLLGDHNLAAICGVHIRSFMGMRDRLALLFEPDETGLWRDYELEEQRDTALRTRAKRAQAGRMGALATRGAGRESVPGEVEPSANAVAFAAAEEAEFEAEAAEAADFAAAHARANAVAPLASQHAERERDESSIFQESPLSSPAAAAGGRDATTELLANAPAPGAATPLDARVPDAAGAKANAQAPAGAEDLPSRPPSEAAAEPQPTDRPAAQPSAEAIFAKLRQACGAKLQNGLLTPEEIKPIRALIDEGFDLDSEIVPGIADKVLRLSGKLETFRASFLRTGVEARAKRRAAPAAAERRSQVPAGVFIGKDWPQWAPWCDHLQKSGATAKTAIQFKQGLGNYFPSLWPPGYATASPVAAE